VRGRTWEGDQSVVLLTLLIGVLNVCLGYALAVWLGYGPPGLSAAWQALGVEPATDDRRTGDKEAVPQPADAQQPTPLRPVPVGPADAQSDAAAEAPAPDETPPPQEMADLLGSIGPALWDLDGKYVETSVLKLNVAMIQSAARATEIDSRLRACQDRIDAETIQSCLAELRKDCETYLAEQSEAAAQFHGRLDELGELSTLGEQIEAANLEQAAQIETTLSNLQYMDFQSDLAAAGHRLLAEIGHLRVARHRMRDNQEAAFLAIARHQNRMDKIEKQLYRDALTGLYNRIGLEVTLYEWWREGRHQTRQICAAVLDLDNFGRINEEHGPLVGDRILLQLAQVIRRAVDKGAVAGRLSGESFLALLPDVGPRVACKNAETMRQSIGKITFLRGAQAVRVTVAGGVAEVRPGDTPESLLQRLEGAMRQAKQSGPNRLFFHDGKEASLVESPSFGAEPVEIAV